MKSFLRKSLWWAPPLIVLLSLAATYLSLRHRRDFQDQIAQEIVDLGGSVEVRSQAPLWLFHFASDGSRSRFSDSEPIPVWGPGWLRNSFFGDAIGASILACDIADVVSIRLLNRPEPDPDAPEGGLAAAMFEDDYPSQKTHLDQLPKLLDAMSRLSTVREVDFFCEPTYRFDSKVLPRGVEKLSIRLPSFEKLHLDLTHLPTTLRELDVSCDYGSGSIQAEFGGESPLTNLQTLSLRDTDLESTSFDHIAKCTKLRKLLLDAKSISDAVITQLRELKELETLEIYGPELTDAGLESLKHFPKLKSLKIFVRKASDQKLAELKSLIPEVSAYRIPPPTEFESTLSIRGGGIIPYRRNGFDRPAMYGGPIGMF